MKILKDYTTSFNSIGIIPFSENMTGLKLSLHSLCKKNQVAWYLLVGDEDHHRLNCQNSFGQSLPAVKFRHDFHKRQEIIMSIGGLNSIPHA